MARGPSAYRELADELRRAILASEYADGLPLPTELVLTRSHRVSRQTVRRAMQDLVAGGLVYRVAGRGTFAVDQADRAHPYVRSMGSIVDLMGLSSDTQLCVVRPMRRSVHGAAQRLDASGELGVAGFPPYHKHVAFCLTTVNLPAHVADLLADVTWLRRKGSRSTDTVIGLLDERLPRAITHAEQTISAVEAPPEAQEQLGVPDTTPLLEIDRLYRDADGRPVELAVSHFLPEHYEYRVTLRRDQR